MFDKSKRPMWRICWCCLTRECFCVKGRTTRRDYWTFALFSLLLYTGLAVVNQHLSRLIFLPPVVWITIFVLIFLVNIWLLCATISAAVRRLHDAGYSGWWILLPVIPFVLTFFKSVEEQRVSDEKVGQKKKTFLK